MLTDSELLEVELQPLLFGKLSFDELRRYLCLAVAEIRLSREVLRVLHAANAEGTCPTCPTAEAWESGELDEIRRAIEEKAHA